MGLTDHACRPYFCKSVGWKLYGLFIGSFLLFSFTVACRTLLSLPKIVICDVGQGDAILVRSAGRNVLVDTGPDESVVDCLQEFVPWYDSKLDLLVLSHQDSDHIGGASAVIDRYEIGQIAWNGKEASTATYTELANRLKKHANVIVASQGHQWRWAGTQLTVVWPPGGEMPEGQNQAGIGLIFRLGSFGFLTLGDLDCTQELAVMGGILLNHWQIAKISHHGSKTSTCDEIFAWNRPEAAVVSAGRGNKYSHPEEGVVARLQENVPLVLRTDLLGPLEIELGDLEFRWRAKKATQLQKRQRKKKEN